MTRDEPAELALTEVVPTPAPAEVFASRAARRDAEARERQAEDPDAAAPVASRRVLIGAGLAAFAGIAAANAGSAAAIGSTGAASIVGPNGNGIGPNRAKIVSGSTRHHRRMKRGTPSIKAADRDQSFAASARRVPASPGVHMGTPAQAAATMAAGAPDNAANHAHLLARATFGARASDYAALGAQGIDMWLSNQLNPGGMADPEGDKVWAAYPLSRMSISGVRASVKEFNWDAAQETAQATLGAQVFSQRQLYEVVVDVFSNVLNVTTPSDSVWATGTDYAVNVIRRFAFGRYADMLKAAMRHPAMLTYLNNNESTKTNVNENLGRELLELHTMGVGSGYTETDVRTSAYILSGRQINYDTSEFVYNPDDHYTGPVTTAWFSDPNATGDGGLAVGDAFVDSLAHQRATAITIARKLAVRFVSDTPPDSLITRLADAYLANDTAIVPMLKVLFSSTEFWGSAGAKWRRPLEDAVGTARAVGVAFTDRSAKGVQDLYWNLQNLGHAPLRWVPPNGYPDVATAWMSASQMVSRWNLHRALTGGWWDGLLAPTKLEDELKPTAGMTNAQWIDAISQRIIGSPMSPEHSAVLLTYLGVSGGAVAPPGDNWRVPQLAALVLDSPHFQLR